MRLVLDNEDQGFLTIDREGTLSAEHSAIVEMWLGKLPTAAKFSEYLGETDANGGIRFEFAWDEIREDIMPLELCLEQLPKSLTIGLQHFSFSYRPIMDGARQVSYRDERRNRGGWQRYVPSIPKSDFSLFERN